MDSEVTIEAGSDNRAQFTTTHWSVVLAAQASPDASGAASALEKLCRTYWYPLYVYARRRRYSHADAKDLTQEFFARFLEKNYLASVDRGKGKFRSFLLASMKHFLGATRVREGALKRGGGYAFISLDDRPVEERYLLEPESDATPEKAYDQRWATTVMEQALARLREEFSTAGKGPLFERLKEFLSRQPDEGEYAAMAQEVKIAPGAIGVAVHRMRQRYGELVHAEVANTVAHPTDVEEEVRYLFSILTGV